MPKRKRCEKCRKKQYPNAASAFHAALASSRVFGGGFRVFQCPHKNGYHITSKTKGAIGNGNEDVQVGTGSGTRTSGSQ